MRRRHLVIVLTVIILLFGPPSYERWRIRSSIANLKHEDAAVREMAAARLADIGPQDEDVIAALVDVLVDEKFTSATVARALEKIGPSAIPTLLEVLEDEDARRRYWGSKPEFVVSRTPRLFGVLAGVGRPALPSLIKLLNDEDRKVRGIAADTLELMGPLAEDAIPALMEAANNEEERRLRSKEVNKPLDTLIKIGRPAVPALIASMKDSDPDVQSQAVDALNLIGPKAEEAVPALIDALKLHARKQRGASFIVSSDAGSALASIGEPAVPALIETLKDEHVLVRFEAASALGTMYRRRMLGETRTRVIGPAAKQAVAALIDALKDDSSVPKEYLGLVPQHAAKALGQIGPDATDAVPALIEATKDENEFVRQQAAEALKKIDLEAAAKGGAK